MHDPGHLQQPSRWHEINDYGIPANLIQMNDGALTQVEQPEKQKRNGILRRRDDGSKKCAIL